MRVSGNRWAPRRVFGAVTIGACTGTGKAVDQCWRAPERGWVPYKGTLLDWQTLGFFGTLPPTNGRRWAPMGAEKGFWDSDYRCLPARKGAGMGGSALPEADAPPPPRIRPKVGGPQPIFCQTERRQRRRKKNLHQFLAFRGLRKIFDEISQNQNFSKIVRFCSNSFVLHFFGYIYMQKKGV